MKITNVEVLVLKSPGLYNNPEGSEEPLGPTYMGIVRVTTDAGITGYSDMETAASVAKAAVEAPRFDTQHYVSSFDDHEFLAGSLNLESRIDEKTIADLKARGHKVTVQSAWGTLSSPTVIIYNQQTGVSSAGADPRRGRYAVAW